MVGIIILNFNTANDVIKCVNSIDKNTSISYRIYIVDGCSTDDSYDYLSKYFRDNKNIDVMQTDINGGYSYGNNFGIIKAINNGADAILIINPDIILLNNAIDQMYQELIKENDLAIVAPRIYNQKNDDIQFASKLLTFNNFIWSKKPLAYLHKNKANTFRFHPFDNQEDFKFQGMVSGCCFIAKTSDLINYKLFDTNVFLFYEEDILAYKITQSRKYVKILSKSQIIHNHSTSVKREGEAFVRFHRFLSSQYVLRNYAKLNDFQIFFVTIIHILPFAANSTFSKSYRKLFLKFCCKSISIIKQN